MNVAEYIKLLQALPQDARVVRDGYEDGVDDAQGPERIRIALNVNSKWYYGDHEQRPEGEGDADAVVLR